MTGPAARQVRAIETRPFAPVPAAQSRGEIEAGARHWVCWQQSCQLRPSSVKPPLTSAQTGVPLHTATGARKYRTAGERDAFLRQPMQPVARCGLSA